jgi:Uma2 family endonuclease
LQAGAVGISPAPEEVIDAPLDRQQLITRWQALCDDPSFEDLAAKIELTEWGEILMSPVSKTHGLSAAHIAEVLRMALGGRVMVEVGVATAIGVRAPHVAWCSEQYLSSHPEEAPLSGASELCIEIASVSNALPKLREKAAACLSAGAIESWVVFSRSRQIEIYGSEGRRDTTSFTVDLAALFR